MGLGYLTDLLFSSSLLRRLLVYLYFLVLLVLYSIAVRQMVLVRLIERTIDSEFIILFKHKHLSSLTLCIIISHTPRSLIVIGMRHST